MEQAKKLKDKHTQTHGHTNIHSNTQMSNPPNISHGLEYLAALFASHPFTALVLPLFLVSIFIYKWRRRIPDPTTRKTLPPPSPPKLPIIGNLHQLAAAPLPHRTLYSLSQKYGKIMLLHLGSKPTLVISSADLAREIMKTHDVIFSNKPPSLILESLLYDRKDVAVAPYGEHWRQRKSICVLQLLSNKRVRSLRRIREEETSSMVESIRRTGSSSPVNLTELIIKVINDVVCRAVLGKKMDSGQGEEGSADMMEILKEFSYLVGVFDVRDFIPWLGWIVSRVSGLVGRVDRVARGFDQFLEAVIEEHSGRPVGQEEGGQKVYDFVDVLLKIQRDDTAGYPIDRDEIKALLLDMFAAGTDTSSTLLDWAMTELLRHPQVLKRLQEELRKIPHRETSAMIYEHELEKSKYLKAVIKETLRLHPPIPISLPRELTQDVNINGFHIAAGTQVIINAWTIHRDSAVWDEPDKFYPERFLNTDQTPTESIGQGFEWIPFGSGRRGCPGISFANAINELVLANLIGKFEWTLPDGARGEDLDVSEGPGITAHRKHSLLAVATPYYYENQHWE